MFDPKGYVGHLGHISIICGTFGLNLWDIRDIDLTHGWRATAGGGGRVQLEIQSDPYIHPAGQSAS